MNLIEKICQELEVELNETWTGNDNKSYLIKEDGSLWNSRLNGLYLDDIRKVLTGELKPVWKPKEGDCYYIPFLDSIEEMWAIEKWEDDTYDNIMWKRGLVFKTKEEAIKCANKMLQAIKEE